MLQVHKVMVLEQGDCLMGVLHPLKAQLALVKPFIDLDKVEVRVGLLQILMFLRELIKLFNNLLCKIALKLAVFRC